MVYLILSDLKPHLFATEQVAELIVAVALCLLFYRISVEDKTPS